MANCCETCNNGGLSTGKFAVNTIDRDWFLDALAKQNKSVRGLARHMEIDASAVSRMFSGKRKMRMDEAGEIARFLGATVSEVLSHAGVAIDLDGQPTKIVLAAIINADGVVQKLPEPRPMPQSVIDKAQGAIGLGRNSTIVAAQVRAASGPLLIWDDAVLLFAPSDNVSHDAIGTLSICRLRDGQQIVGKIERARKTGEATITGIDAVSREVVLITATPIIAVIP